MNNVSVHLLQTQVWAVEELKKMSTIKESVCSNAICWKYCCTNPTSCQKGLQLDCIWPNPANSQNQCAEVWAVRRSAGKSRYSSRAITLTSGNCWPADSKEPLEQLTVQTVGSWRRSEVGNVFLESTYPHSILTFPLQLPVRSNADTAVELRQQVTQTMYNEHLGL